MKKEERLHRLLGEIDDDLVADAARRPIRKAVWVPAVAAAACVALAVGLWQGGVFDPAPIPLETPNGSTTTAKPTTTTTTIPKKTPLIWADEPECFGDMVGTEEVDLSRNISIRVSPALEEKMKLYKSKDVKYAVIVETLTASANFDKYWASNEEWVQYEKEHRKLWAEFETEAKRLDPSYNGKNVKEWSDELLAIEDRIQAHSQKGNDIKDRYWPIYKKYFYDAKAETLKEIIGTELVPITTDERFHSVICHSPEYAYFMELTSDEINSLVECADYLIRLRHPDGDAEDIVLSE